MLDRHLRAYFARYAGRYSLGLGLLMAASLVIMLPPVIIGRVVDAIDAGTTRTHLGTYALLILGLAVAESIVRFTSRVLINGTSRRVEYEMRNDMATRLMALDQAYYLKAQTGDLMARCTNDLQRVRDLAGPAALEIIRACLMMLIGFGFMLAIDVKLALISLAYFPLIAALLVRFRGTVENKYRGVQDQFGVLSNRVQENLSGIRSIKAYAQEDSETETFARENRELMRLTMSWAVYMGTFWPLMGLAAGASLILTLWFGGHDVVSGRLTTGQFVQFNSYLAILSSALIPLGWTATQAQQGIASMHRVSELLSALASIEDPPRPSHVEVPRGAIEFENVSFGYGETPVLRDVSLSIAPGETVALVGMTGAGKTTLVNLLVRLHDPQHGAVRIDGVDLRALPLAEVRGLVAFVPQETFLFSDTLRENIALALTAPDGPALDVAVETSQLVTDLPQLTHGLDTVLGERGVTLSGGQKQRTALARALLKEAPILVLDDALSHVDTHTEEEILRRLHAYLRQRTTIIIAHRTSTLTAADRLVVLSEGRIVEQGTHESLLALDGVYARFYRRQLLAEQLEDAPEVVETAKGAAS